MNYNKDVDRVINHKIITEPIQPKIAKQFANGLLEFSAKSKVKLALEKCRNGAQRNGWGFEGQANRSF